jgi:hypothetical protein
MNFVSIIRLAMPAGSGGFELSSRQRIAASHPDSLLRRRVRRAMHWPLSGANIGLSIGEVPHFTACRSEPMPVPCGRMDRAGPMLRPDSPAAMTGIFPAEIRIHSSADPWGIPPLAKSGARSRLMTP